ncbi:MAG: GTP pyrophosphokinase family protein [Defluviitaleaceae bacterium]|nr:GTP pyrophosphokinase family protein [Defluviitaleaceae bacterium]
MTVQFSDVEFEKLKKMLCVYEWGLQTLMTKLRIVHSDLKSFQDKDIIDHISSRLKTPSSIALKLYKLGKPLTVESAAENLFDIAGCRIICHFNEDINSLVGILRSMPDINILTEKDYVTNPKPSGYRSYHIILEVPVFYSGRIENVKAEIQIRTEAMNFWSTLEHKVRYKYKGEIPKHLSDELALIAQKTDELDNRMFLIHEIISMLNE